MVCGKYHEPPWNQKRKIGQRESTVKGAGRDDQSPHPGRLHGASLATAMQRPCRPLLLENIGILRYRG